MRAYLRFDVRLPAGSIITGARLELYTRSISPVAGYQVHAVQEANWDEATIDAADAPAFSGTLGTSGPWTTAGYRDVRLPATSIHPGLITLGAATASTYVKVFASRESATPPRLVVEYAAPAPDAAGAPLAPASGALLGAWHDDASSASTRAGFTEFEAAVGRTLQIDHRYVSFGDTSWPG